MKEAVTKVIDTLTQEDFHAAFQKSLENKCIATGRDYFEGDKSFIFVLSIKVPTRKKSGNLFKDTSYLMILKQRECVYVQFLCLMAYQSSWIIKCQRRPCRRIAVVQFNP